MRGIVICPNIALRQRFEEAAAQYNLTLVKRLDSYPSPEAFGRMARAWAPEVVFLSLENHGEAAAFCRETEAEFPDLQRIGLHSSPDPATFKLALRLRVRELLIAPFHQGELAQALSEVGSYLEKHPINVVGCSDRFYAFTPAKAGVGASTIAANVTRACAAMPKVRALLADFDIHSGVAGFLFNAEHEFSLIDAADRSKDLDDESWRHLVKKVADIDLLLSGAPRLAGDAPDAKKVGQLLDFMRRNYSVVTADLPDVFDELSLTVLREASRIFLVTTPELPALRLARQKVGLFRRLELDDRVSLVLNRVTKRMELSLDEIGETVGLPVTASFPSDYVSVTKSIREAQMPASLAAPFHNFAETLFRKPEQEKKRFIERFAVVPMRYGFRTHAS
jgi:MinD-like ATPase involved in chromosome partitioning or flagellar assembly